MTHAVQQVELARGDARMLVWVDAGLALRAGQEVTGKDRHRWRVERVYGRTLAPHLLNRGWTVGGLEP